MIVRYERRMPESLQTYYSFPREPIEPCCDDMGQALRDNFIQFGEYGETMLNSGTMLNIFKCSPYLEGAVWDEMPIKFCPFCGTAIQCEEVAG
jgi:hypothetical protein